MNSVIFPVYAYPLFTSFQFRLLQKFSWLGENGDEDDIDEEEKAIKKLIATTETNIGLM